ncbi:MAG: hypothetical protein ACPGFA_10335 [Pikeienuella sp.]
MRPIAMTVAIAACLGLGACQTIDELAGLEEEVKESIAKVEEGPPAQSVSRIDTLELGRLHRGYMLTAIGLAPGLGYWDPKLVIRYNGELAPDGFYEFDLVARPPYEPIGNDQAPIPARRVRGDFEITPEMLRSARGVRVWSERDNVEGRF